MHLSCYPYFEYSWATIVSLCVDKLFAMHLSFKQEMAIHLRPQHFAIGIVSILNGKADVEVSRKQAVFIDRALV